MYEKKIPLGWDAVESFINSLAEQLSIHEEPVTGVYGIPRGGLVLAVMLSHKMNIPLLQAPCEGCVVVDDTCDTGRALRPYQGRYMTATFFIDSSFEDKRDFKPDYVFREKNGQYVIFPWEMDDEDN